MLYFHYTRSFLRAIGSLLEQHVVNVFPIFNSNNSAPSIRCRYSRVNEAIDSEWNITTGLFGLPYLVFL
jgi:hypothetical protein